VGERESMCVQQRGCACECMCVCVKLSVHVCVFERQRKREREKERERGGVCESVYVCERDSVCVL